MIMLLIGSHRRLDRQHRLPLGVNRGLRAVHPEPGGLFPKILQDPGCPEFTFMSRRRYITM